MLVEQLKIFKQKCEERGFIPTLDLLIETLEKTYEPTE